MAQPVSRSRRVRGLALAACAAVVLPVAAASPAVAQTTTSSTSTSGATSAAALRLVLNLPQGNTLQVEIDPVAGTVRSVTGSGPEAQAYAAIIAGGLAGEGEAFGPAQAMLPKPTEDSGGPLDALNEGINGSDLGDFLQVNALVSEAAVTTAPSSTSEAGTELAVGLPPALAEGLAVLFEQIIAGLEDLILATEPTQEVLDQFCAGLTAVTDPVVEDGLETLPVIGPIVGDVEEGLLDGEAGTLCQLRTFLQQVVDELEAGLAELGELGLLNVGTLEASQRIDTEGSQVTATATARIADVDVLGVANPFGDVEALETASTAVVAPGTADATVEQDTVDVDVAPIAIIEAQIPETLEGSLLGIELDGVEALVGELNALLEALAGIGVNAVDPTTAELSGCPTALTTGLGGTFEEAGVCAAAAAAGYGLAVTLPAELAEPLGIVDENGEVLPLLSLAFSPSAAVARAATTTTTNPPAPENPDRPLPRTGAETALAAAGVALLAGAALVRRRRSAADL